VLEAHPDVQLCIMGPEQISSLFSWVPSNRIEIRPGGSIDEYYRFVETLDIGLCPNLRTAFNRCRSDIKFLEYAAFGVVAVCSDIEPYRESVKHQENGCLFSTPGELEELLHSLIRDPERRRRLSRAAYECVASVRTEGGHARQKLEQYQAWAAEAGKPLSTAATAEPLALECTYPDSRYVRLGEGALESALYEGLRCAQHGQNTPAVSAFLEASRLAPDFYLPWLLLGSSELHSEKAVTYLRQAAALAPDSPHVLLTLASRHEANGDWTLAQPLWERCMTIAPWLGLAQTRLGAFAEKAGDVALAVGLYAQAFAQNPFFAPPIVQLAEKALAQSDFPLLENLMKAAMAGDAWLWQYPYYLGRALLAQNQSSAAAEALEKALSLSPEPRAVLPFLAKAALAQGQVEKAKSILHSLASTPAR
jgi:tetratricopeptide (TPR) repeat protein